MLEVTSEAKKSYSAQFLTYIFYFLLFYHLFMWKVIPHIFIFLLFHVLFV